MAYYPFPTTGQLPTFWNRIASFLTWHCDYVCKNVNAGTEWLWVGGRLAAAAAIIGATFLSAPGTGVQFVFTTLMLVVAIYSIYAGVMLSRGRVMTAFVMGFVLDNVVIIVGWLSFLKLAGDNLQTNDMYLVMIPVIIMAFLRLGWFFGGLYAAMWLSWLAWSSIHFYPAGSYDVEQLPIRIVFIALTAGIVARMVTMLHSQREREIARVTDLESLEKLKSDLLNTVAHELKSPLTAVRVAGDILHGSEDDLTPQQRRMTVRVLRKGIERLDEITERSLDYSRLSANETPVDLQEVNLAELVEGLSELVSLSFNTKGQTLKLDISPELPKVVVDPVHIERVFMSLLENANRYTPEGGNIAIHLHQHRSEIYASVSDDGPGIPVEERKHIFDEYYRGSQTDRQPGRGIGLGLAIAKKLVEIHGGKIGVDGKNKNGTTIFFTLPTVVATPGVTA